MPGSGVTLLIASLAVAGGLTPPAARPSPGASASLVAAGIVKPIPVSFGGWLPGPTAQRPFSGRAETRATGLARWPAQPAPPKPRYTTLRTLPRDLVRDVAVFPQRRSTWVLLGIGAAAAAAVHPFDQEVNDYLQQSDDLKKALRPGRYIGSALTQGTLAVSVYAIGRYALPPAPGQHSNKVTHVGLDLLRANLVTQAFTYTIKVAVGRDRPTGECCAFPSGHASLTATTATVLERHFGFRATWPMFVLAGYVSASRLTENRHFLSDVVFGSALGIATGWTVVGRHGRDNFALYPVPTRGGVMVAGHWTPSMRPWTN